MARTRYVTRTLMSTEAEVKTLNTETDEVGSVVVCVQGEYQLGDKALEKAVKKVFEARNLEDTVFCKITAVTTAVKQYRMLESLFMSMAEVTEVETEDSEDDE